jgi:hypothetical protein
MSTPFFTDILSFSTDDTVPLVLELPILFGKTAQFNLLIYR